MIHLQYNDMYYFHQNNNNIYIPYNNFLQLENHLKKYNLIYILYNDYLFHFLAHHKFHNFQNILNKFLGSYLKNNL